MPRTKTYYNTDQLPHTELVIDLDSVCFVYKINPDKFAVHFDSCKELIFNESEVTMKKFIKLWKGEE